LSDGTNPNPNEDGTGADGTMLGGDPGNPNPDGGNPGGNPGDGGGDDLSTIFTPEDIQSKRESLAAAKAEEERRAALTDEEREAEDAERAKGEAWNAPPPEKYEPFTMPEGHEQDQAMADTFEPVFRELGLSQAKAQKLIEAYHEHIVPKNLETTMQQWDDLKAKWAEETKNDKEYGGEKFQENFHFAAKAMDQFATPELRAALNEYGIGNHPEMVRLMIRVGKALSDDPNLPGKSAGNDTKSPYFNYKT